MYTWRGRKGVRGKRRVGIRGEHTGQVIEKQRVCVLNKQLRQTDTEAQTQRHRHRHRDTDTDTDTDTYRHRRHFTAQGKEKLTGVGIPNKCRDCVGDQMEQRVELLCRLCAEEKHNALARTHQHGVFTRKGNDLPAEVRAWAR